MASVVQFLRQLAGMYLPSTAILQWLDEHVSFRLSILFAYLFGKSELAVQLLRWLGAAGACCHAVLRPVIAVLGYATIPSEDDAASKPPPMLVLRPTGAARALEPSFLKTS